VLRRHRQAIALSAITALALSACGSKQVALTDITLLPTTTSTTIDPTATTAPATTVARTSPPSTAPAIGPWKNATDGIEGLPSECGNLSMVAALPDRDLVVASVAQQGLWSIAPGSDTWTRLGQGPGSAKITNRMSALITDPSAPNTWWESGLYNAGGIYRTDDAGVTFRQIGTLSSVQSISIDFTDPARATMLASLHERSTILRTSDGGNVWVDITPSLPPNTGYSTGPLVIDSKTFLLGTSSGTGAGVFRTTDGGTTWTTVREGGVIGNPLRTKSGELLWIAEGTQSLIRSSDNGLTWTKVSRSGVVSQLATGLTVLGDGRLATLGNNVVIASSDDGATWRTVGPPTPFSPNGLVAAPKRHAIYAWKFDCQLGANNPVLADSIVRLDLPAT
jgi:photosystem II stability/assembly factor-like uncharacterized protein